MCIRFCCVFMGVFFVLYSTISPAMHYVTKAFRCGAQYKTISTAAIAMFGIGILAEHKSNFISKYFTHNPSIAFSEIYDFENGIHLTQEQFQERSNNCVARKISWVEGLKIVGAVTAAWWGICTAYEVTQAACNLGRNMLNSVFSKTGLSLS